MEYSAIVVRQESQAIGRPPVINNTISKSVQTVELSNGGVPYANAVGPQFSNSVAVPEGGSTLLFILAALTAMGWAATKRYCSRTEGRTTAARITG
jgi:hypothetical protein